MHVGVIEFFYDLFAWFLYSLLIYRHLIPKKECTSFIAVYFVNIISIFITFIFYSDVFVRQFIFLIPVIFVSKYFYEDQIQWRLVVIFLSTLICLLPETFFKMISYNIFHMSSVQLISNYNGMVFVLSSMVFAAYKAIDYFFECLYRMKVEEENKIMLIMVLSVIVFAVIPVSFYLGNKSILYLILFIGCGLLLDFLLIEYVRKYADARQMNKVQAQLNSNNKEDLESQELYELRHDIAGYINALKILEKEKRK